jgi:hypothetical protein
MTNVAKINDTAQEAQLPADPMVSMIERIAMDPNSDLAKLEKMLDMKERMEAQTARTSFARSLSEARAEIPPIIKDATVDFTSNKGRTYYKHETLSGIAKVIDPILSRYGLSYRFRTDQGQGGVKVTCIITHSSGHFEETSLSGAPDSSGNKNGFQAVGSAVTYLQRYTLKAALGLSAEVDDDAQGAAPRQEKRQQGPSREAIEAATDSLSNSDDMDQLKAIWSDLPKAVQSVPAVINAKNERKTELDKEPEPQRASIDDEIPY